MIAIYFFLLHLSPLTDQMEKSLSHKHLGLRFRRWSRKRYAAFCSMGRYVMIGHLKNNIADASLSRITTSGVFKSFGFDENRDENQFRDTGQQASLSLFVQVIIPSGYTVEYPAIRYTPISTKRTQRQFVDFIRLSLRPFRLIQHL